MISDFASGSAKDDKRSGDKRRTSGRIKEKESLPSDINSQVERKPSSRRVSSISRAPPDRRVSSARQEPFVNVVPSTKRWLSARRAVSAKTDSSVSKVPTAKQLPLVTKVSSTNVQLSVSRVPSATRLPSAGKITSSRKAIFVEKAVEPRLKKNKYAELDWSSSSESAKSEVRVKISPQKLSAITSFSKKFHSPSERPVATAFIKDLIQKAKKPPSFQFEHKDESPSERPVATAFIKDLIQKAKKPPSFLFEHTDKPVHVPRNMVNVTRIVGVSSQMRRPKSAAKRSGQADLYILTGDLDNITKEVNQMKIEIAHACIKAFLRNQVYKVSVNWAPRYLYSYSSDTAFGSPFDEEADVTFVDAVLYLTTDLKSNVDEKIFLPTLAACIGTTTEKLSVLEMKSNRQWQIIYGCRDEKAHSEVGY